MPGRLRYRVRGGRWTRVVGRGLTALERPAQGWPVPVLAWAAHLTRLEAVIGYRVAALLHGFPVGAGQPPGDAIRLRGGPRVTSPGDGSGLIGVVDVLFAAARVVIEVDGFRAHSCRDTVVRDRPGRNRLIAEIRAAVNHARG